MKYLFKNYLKKIFADKKYFFILFFFIFFIFILLMSGVSIYSRLTQISNDIDANRNHYKYNLEYTSRIQNNDTDQNAISPFGLISNDVTKYTTSDGKEYNFSNISFLTSDNYFDWDYDEIANKLNDPTKYGKFNIIDYLNYDENYEEYFSILKNSTLIDGDSVNSNSNDDYEEINGIDHYFTEFWNYYIDKRKGFDGTKQLLINNVFENKNNISNNQNDENILTVTYSSTNGDNYSLDASNIYELGIQNFNQLVKVNVVENGETKNSFYELFGELSNDTSHDGSEALNILDNTINTKNGSLTETKVSQSSLPVYNDSKLYDNSWFVRSNFKKEKVYYKNLDLYSAYVSAVSERANFNAEYINRMIYSNNSTKEKFVFVDRTKARYDLSGNVAYQTHNGVNLKITKQDEHYGENVRNTIVVSERYAERNDLELGGAFKFKNNQTSYEFEVGAFGFDYDNSYPLIYDSDFIPDTKNEAIIFITADDFADSSSIMDTFVADSSKVYFRYYGNDLDVDTDKLNSALRFSPLDFTSTSDEVGNLNTLVYNLRTNAASYFSIGFFWMFLVLFVIFFIISLVSIYILISKNIKKNYREIGIIKANGYKNSEIALEYGLKTFIPSFIAGVLAYAFVIIVQLVIYKEISVFFDLDIRLNLLGWVYPVVFIVIICGLTLFGFVFAITSLRKPIVDLLNNQVKQRQGSFLLKVIDKMKIKNYSTNMTLKQFAVSWNKIFSLSVTLFISAFMLSILIIAPTSVKNIETNYYANTNYSLENNYEKVAVNNPLSYYSTYSDATSYDTFFPDRYSRDSNDFSSSVAINDSWDESNMNYSLDTFGLNFLYIKNKHFSIQAIQNMLDSLGSKSSDIESTVSTLMSSVIPSFFGQTLTTQVDWKHALAQLITGKMPAELLEYWNDEQTRNSFSIDFQSTAFNEAEDSLASYITNNYGDQSFKTIGLDDGQTVVTGEKKSDKIEKLTSSENATEVLASTKLLKSSGKEIGDEISSTYKVNEMQYQDDNGKWHSINSNDWFYDSKIKSTINGESKTWNFEDENNLTNELTPLLNTDLDRYTYESYDNGGDGKIGLGTSYYLDENHVDGDGDVQSSDGNWYHEYNSIQDVVLRIAAKDENGNNILPSSWTFNTTDSDLFDENNGAIKWSSDHKYLYVRPYAWIYSQDSQAGNTFSSLLTYFSSNKKEPTTWMDAATNIKFRGSDDSLKENPYFIQTNDVVKSTTMKIVGEVGVYDQNVVYTKRDYVNNLLGVGTGLKYQSFFNTKFTSNKRMNDIFLRIGVTMPDGNSSVSGLGNLSSQSSATDFIGKKLEMFDTIFAFVVKLVILFILIIIALVVIAVSMVSSIFIEQFYNTIMLFKTIGYSNSEIHKFILGIYAPINIIFILIGTFIPAIVLQVADTFIAKSGMVLPLDFMYIVPIIISLIMTGLFLGIYFISYRMFVNKSIQEQSSQSE